MSGARIERIETTGERFADGAVSVVHIAVSRPLAGPPTAGGPRDIQV